MKAILMAKPIPIDVDRCKELFEYRDGKLIWKISNSNRGKVGTISGALNSGGYFQVAVDKRRFKVSRIIYAMHHGDPGEMHIDHINHNIKDDRIENLRMVTRKENGRNQSKHRTNTSGVMGVSWDKKSRKWKAEIKVDGKRIHCGFFNHLQAAAVERKYQEIKYGFHENHGS